MLSCVTTDSSDVRNSGDVRNSSEVKGGLKSPLESLIVQNSEFNRGKTNLYSRYETPPSLLCM